MARYWCDWKPEEFARKPRNSAYSVGVSVAYFPYTRNTSSTLLRQALHRLG